MYEGIQGTCTVFPQGVKTLLIKLHSGFVHTVFDPAANGLALLFPIFCWML